MQIPLDATERAVELTLSQYGKVLKVALKRRFDGSSKGCALVTVKDHATGETMIKALHQKVG